MEEDKGGSGPPALPAPPPPQPSVQSQKKETPVGNQRQRFTVELRPGETTIVSWKRLVREGNRAGSGPTTSEAPSGAHPALESRISPVGVGQSAEGEGKDQPAPNRFSAVIEKIERLYMGNQSSDEEELDNVPDDDEYDTEDSFIDDAELDEYFQVDQLATKHNGFFVNRGKLEKVNEPISSPNHASKKRRRKDLGKAHVERDGETIPNKHAKMGNVRMKAAARGAPLVGIATGHSQISSHLNEHYEEQKALQIQGAQIGHAEKKSADSNFRPDQLSGKAPSKDAYVFPGEPKDGKRQKTGVIHSRDVANKSKLTSDSSDAMHPKFYDKSHPSHVERQSSKFLNDTNNVEFSTKIRYREKNGSDELPDLNSLGGKYPTHTLKSLSMPAKEGSTIRPKGTMLERAIRELEKIVAESRPPTLEIQETDPSAQGVKRRLPQDVKQKLAKVARLAQSSQGKISEELINRLMSILGHLVQLKTLKRNLKEMVVLGLSAKQAKADRFQQIKNEVIEMIKTRVSSLNLKAAEQRDGPSDDFQEGPGSEEKGNIKGRYIMDDAMEDKICDLYDLYVEGMDEDKGPQSRKLYVELAELWPNGSMDNNGIKGAVCRAKGRKRQLYIRHKDEVKVRRKKISPAVKIEEAARGEPSLSAQHRVSQEKQATDSSSNQIFMSPDRLIPNPTTTNQHISTSARPWNLSLNTSNVHRPRPEKVRPSVSTGADEAGKVTGVAVVKKKVKRKPDSDLGEIHVNPTKIQSQHHERERHKSHKHSSGHHQPTSSHQLKPSSPAVGIPGCEQPS